ncbi:hypothetical protein SARC_02528 [Sphaeroforma arctica JP610]|uniref:Rap-GAP domain-containing protein n=1 Tax=Sphaeroforma arctica JP610 TaxID=667725 RepID=A0A0L0G8N0_9EUKA|nr:hypothetical protein SARC_02528 [Sphaeroforma arctica JP610]KNC85269.1 hypothetical protein SARC_02528 [Sphaeroforma arctica JP610]|eukprot:XP_014159171.1 hypothetical protein SARC_02528 [Sphaeroforma arctica JP610]
MTGGTPHLYPNSGGATDPHRNRSLTNPDAQQALNNANVSVLNNSATESRANNSGGNNDGSDNTGQTHTQTSPYSMELLTEVAKQRLITEGLHASTHGRISPSVREAHAHESGADADPDAVFSSAFVVSVPTVPVTPPIPLSPDVHPASILEGQDSPRLLALPSTLVSASTTGEGAGGTGLSLHSSAPKQRARAQTAAARLGHKLPGAQTGAPHTSHSERDTHAHTTQAPCHAHTQAHTHTRAHGRTQATPRIHAVPSDHADARDGAKTQAEHPSTQTEYRSKPSDDHSKQASTSANASEDEWAIVSAVTPTPTSTPSDARLHGSSSNAPTPIPQPLVAPTSLFYPPLLSYEATSTAAMSPAMSPGFWDSHSDLKLASRDSHPYTDNDSPTMGRGLSPPSDDASGDMTPMPLSPMNSHRELAELITSDADVHGSDILDELTHRLGATDLSQEDPQSTRPTRSTPMPMPPNDKARGSLRDNELRVSPPSYRPTPTAKNLTLSIGYQMRLHSRTGTHKDVVMISPTKHSDPVLCSVQPGQPPHHTLMDLPDDVLVVHLPDTAADVVTEITEHSLSTSTDTRPRPHTQGSLHPDTPPSPNEAVRRAMQRQQSTQSDTHIGADTVVEDSPVSQDMGPGGGMLGQSPPPSRAQGMYHAHARAQETAPVAERFTSAQHTTHRKSSQHTHTHAHAHAKGLRSASITSVDEEVRQVVEGIGMGAGGSRGQGDGTPNTSTTRTYTRTRANTSSQAESVGHPPTHRSSGGRMARNGSRHGQASAQKRTPTVILGMGESAERRPTYIGDRGQRDRSSTAGAGGGRSVGTASGGRPQEVALKESQPPITVTDTKTSTTTTTTTGGHGGTHTKGKIHTQAHTNTSTQMTTNTPADTNNPNPNPNTNNGESRIRAQGPARGHRAGAADTPVHPDNGPSPMHKTPMLSFQAPSNKAQSTSHPNDPGASAGVTGSTAAGYNRTRMHGYSAGAGAAGAGVNVEQGAGASGGAVGGGNIPRGNLLGVNGRQPHNTTTMLSKPARYANVPETPARSAKDVPNFVPTPTSRMDEKEELEKRAGNEFLPSFVLAQLFQYDGKPDALTPLPILPEHEQDGTFERGLRLLDKMPFRDTHKIGVVYVAEGNTSGDDILRNDHGSVRYMKFLQQLGTLIRLENSELYTGGLDREEGADGEFTYHWQDDITEVVFHVATLMPSGQAACVDKKRHIGNDFVTIVYNDAPRTYNLHAIRGQFNFIDLIIQPLEDNTNEVLIRTKEVMQTYVPEKFDEIVSDASLATFVRHIAIHANLASCIQQQNEDYVSNAVGRLRHIKRIGERMTSMAQTTGGFIDLT